MSEYNQSYGGALAANCSQLDVFIVFPEALPDLLSCDKRQGHKLIEKYSIFVGDSEEKNPEKNAGDDVDGVMHLRCEQHVRHVK